MPCRRMQRMACGTRDSVPRGGWGDPVPFLASWHTAAAPGCRADVAHWACVYSRKDWHQGSGDGLGPSVGKDRAGLVRHILYIPRFRVFALIVCRIGDSQIDQITVWPGGLRRWLTAPVRKGVGLNPTAVSVLWPPADSFIYICMHWQSLPEIRRMCTPQLSVSYGSQLVHLRIHMCMHWQSLPEIRRLRIDVRRAGTSCPAPQVIGDLRGRQQHRAQGGRPLQIEQQWFTVDF